MQRKEDLLKSLDILLEDLTQEQIEGIQKFSNQITDPSNISVNDAMKIVKDLNLDIEKLQKNSRRKRAEHFQKNRKEKIGVNEKCPCNSGIKYKKCCLIKTYSSSS